MGGRYIWAEFGWLLHHKETGKPFAFCQNCEDWMEVQLKAVGEYDQAICKTCQEICLDE